MCRAAVCSVTLQWHWNSTSHQSQMQGEPIFVQSQGGAVLGQLRFLQAVPQVYSGVFERWESPYRGWVSQWAQKDLFKNSVPDKMCSMGHGFVLLNYALESLARYIWTGCGNPPAPLLQNSTCWKGQPCREKHKAAFVESPCIIILIQRLHSATAPLKSDTN